jgi:hypothetical protein
MSYKWSTRLKRYVLALALTFILVTVYGFGSTGQYFVPGSATNRGLNPDLPDIETIWAEPLPEPSPEGNVRLVVRFAKELQLEQRFAVQSGRSDLVLRDDGTGGDKQAGDGSFSAITTLDLDELRASQNRVQELQRKLGTNLTVPVFEGRQRVAERPIPPLDSGGSSDILHLSPMGIAEAVDPGKSLLIRDPRVVEDPTRTFNPCTGAGTPMGAWTFGHLMEQMINRSATNLKPQKFVKQWLKQFQKNQVVNGHLVPKRSRIKSLIINPWLEAGGGSFDLAKAPFRLLAIVNRVDLRDSSSPRSNAGEARFVFGALGPGCLPLEFTVIFEFGIQRNDCGAVKDWARQWFDLGSLELGSAEYNTALEAITEQFVRAGAAPSKPNGSALNQLRTNEIALGGVWELREFNILDGALREVTVKMTPDVSFNRTAVLTDFVNSNEADILADRHVVPDQFPAGNPFLGGSAPMGGVVIWDNPTTGPLITSREARHKFSLQTCNGCHLGETQTGFLHIGPAPFGVPARLSLFMTGISVADAADGTPIRQFNELQRRAADLDQLVNTSCVVELLHKPLRMTH